MALGVGRKSLIHNPTNIWSSPAQIVSWPSNHSTSSVCLVSFPCQLTAPSRAASLLVPRASRVAVPAGGGLTGQRAVISRSPPYPLHSPGPAIPVRPSLIEQRPSPKAPASGETVTWRGRRPVLSEVTHLVRLGRCCDGMWSLEASRAVAHQEARMPTCGGHRSPPILCDCSSPAGRRRRPLCIGASPPAIAILRGYSSTVAVLHPTPVPLPVVMRTGSRLQRSKSAECTVGQ
jgi:hypothetical protein